ncbi:MAG: hypothetical protein HOQ05_02035 [Corynebacteriales bacterium]|nr:hypothetical protein [Mycobacteriales bacterium]
MQTPRDLVAAPAIGVDIGGVLIERWDDERYLASPDWELFERLPVTGALTALTQLVDAFAGKVYLVSKCGVRGEYASRLWLSHHRVLEQTGLNPLNVWFCRQWSDKAEIARQLGLSSFVDDRIEVLAQMDSVPYRYLFGELGANALPGMLPAPTWPQLITSIIGAGLVGTPAVPSEPKAAMSGPAS